MLSIASTSRRAWSIGAFLVMGAGSLGVAQLHAQADTQRRADPGAALATAARRDTTDVLLAFSGAISLGAYEAGVDWAMIQFIKRVRADSAYRSARRLPVYRVAAMSGASAGNINVLLASVEYCDGGRLQPPQNSLLWQMWVNTGWNELSPPHARRDTLSGDMGVLDRGSTLRQLIPSLREAMRGSAASASPERRLAWARPIRTFVPGCHVPLGVVATRIRPGNLAFDSHIHVPNQRYIALFDVEEHDGQLRLRSPADTLLRDASLGAQMVLPRENLTTLEPDRVFEVVEASAAYPVVFAPNVIFYEDPACVFTPIAPGCTDSHGESFIDGGVFDNVPVSLAVGIARDLAPPVVDSAVKPAQRRIYYVDPIAARGKLAAYVQSREQATAETRTVGIEAMLQFGNGFVSAARSYELQTFIRSQLGLKREERALIRSSTRAHPVIGEYLGTFAAFLGRPFREYDFYNGIADGIQLVASDILCDRGRTAVDRQPIDAGVSKPPNAPQLAPGRASLPGDMDLGTCTGREVGPLIDSLGLDATARHVVASVLQREYGEVTPVGVGDSPVADGVPPSERVKVLDAVERATNAILEDKRPFDCDPGDLAGSVMCRDGFDRVIGLLARDSVFTDRVNAWSTFPACPAPTPSLARRIVTILSSGSGPDSSDRIRPLPNASGRPSDCLAETVLVQLMADQHSAMRGIIDESFWQLRRTESELRGKQPDHKSAVKVVELVYRSMDQRSRRGLEIDPSSVRPGESMGWSWMHLLPYYAGGTVGFSGTQVGWQPELHTGWHSTTVQMAIELTHLPAGGRTTRYEWSHAVIPGVGRDFSLVWLNHLGVGARIQWNTLSPEISAVALLSKARLSLYAMPSYISPSGHTRMVATVSLADLNGLLYTLVR